MKKAILYIRVSTDEQAEKGCSLSDQEIKLRNYCKAKQIEVATLFKDDYTAKRDFNRPGYLQLKEYLTKHKNEIGYLFVTQWSRFSRNMYEGLGECIALKKLGIEVNAIEQPVDSSVPEDLFMKSIYFAAPQVENERLALRTIAGMRQAIKQGRYVYRVPIGYKRNPVTKSLELDAKYAELVQWCFTEYAKGIYTGEEVRQKANQKGLRLKKQGFLNMLQNQTYLGKVFLGAYKDESETWLPGTHPPLIDSNTFLKVQQIIKRRGKPYKQDKSEIENALPLRGFLKCPWCGRILTGGTPKGNGGKYPYYHCQQTKYGCKFRVSASKAHSYLHEYLKAFQPKEEAIELFATVLADIFNSANKDVYKSRKAVEAQAQKIELQIQKIQDDYLNERLDVKDYNNLKKTLEEKLSNLVMEDVLNIPPDFGKYISYCCELLKNLSKRYADAFPDIQKRLIGLIFPEKLVFTGEAYKTDKLNEVFALICNTGKDLKENSPAKIARLHTEAPAAGLEPATL